jgi:hypothetical protein
VGHPTLRPGLVALPFHPIDARLAGSEIPLLVVDQGADDIEPAVAIYIRREDWTRQPVSLGGTRDFDSLPIFLSRVFL